MEWLTTVYGQLAAVCAALGVLWGGCKAIVALMAWGRKRLEAYRQRKAIPAQTLLLVEQLKQDSEAADARQAAESQRLRGQVEGLGDMVTTAMAQIGTVQQEKLMWAYTHYGLNHAPIPMHTRTSMLEMYEQYTKQAHRNGVPHDFREKISAAPGITGEGG